MEMQSPIHCRKSAALCLCFTSVLPGSIVYAEPFIDVGTASNLFVRTCDMNASSGVPECLPGVPGSIFPPGVPTLNFQPMQTSSTVGTFTSAGNAEGSVGFSGPGLTPTISAYVNTSQTGRISNFNFGIQQYTATVDGTMILNDTAR